MAFIYHAAEAAAAIHYHMVTEPEHGYTQGNERWGNDGMCKVESQGFTFTFPSGDRDCSSSVIEAWELALSVTKFAGALNNATYTGNMLAIFSDSGLFSPWYAHEVIAERGDIYLTHMENGGQHTAMCQSSQPDMLSEFLINEFGDIVGGLLGDQTDFESVYRNYYDFPWMYILKYNGMADFDVTPKQEPGEPINDLGFYYRVHVQDLGWLDPVRDGQVAGTTGAALRCEALKITPPKGLVIDVKAHIQDLGWFTYANVEKGIYDPIIGTTGESKRLECLEIDIVDNPENLKLSYMVHIADFGWTGWVDAGYAAGTVGCGKAIEAIRIKAERR